MMALMVEFAQNLLMVGLWCAGAWLWIKRQDRLAKMLAVVCLLLASTIGPLFMSLTEPLITPDNTSAGLGRIDGVNIMAFTLSAFVVLFYFAARWGSWRTDLSVGVTIGLLIAVAQGALLPDVPLERLMWHGLSLMVVFGVLVVGIRLALARAQTWWQFSLFVTSVVFAASVFIIIVDYGLGERLASI